MTTEENYIQQLSNRPIGKNQWMKACEDQLFDSDIVAAYNDRADEKYEWKASLKEKVIPNLITLICSCRTWTYGSLMSAVLDVEMIRVFSSGMQDVPQEYREEFVEVVPEVISVLKSGLHELLMLGFFDEAERDVGTLKRFQQHAREANYSDHTFYFDALRDKLDQSLRESKVLGN